MYDDFKLIEKSFVVYGLYESISALLGFSYL